MPELRSADAPGPRGVGPRFDLRFEDGRGLLVLAKPLRFAFGSVEELELALGPLRFPLDLSGGATRFRTRRTRIRSARVRLDLAALLSAISVEPHRIVALAPLSNGLALALTDGFGTVAFDASSRMEGADLWLAFSGARSAGEGPAAPLARVLAAVRTLGLDLDETRGAVRVERALSSALMEALVVHGWRVPDDRDVRAVLEVLGPKRVALRTLAAGEAEPTIDAEPFERARRLASVVHALSLGRPDEARKRWEALRERLGVLPDPLAREGRALALEPSLPTREPLELSLALRDALRRGQAIEAAEAARALAEVEPCDAVAVEGLCSAAELADPASRAFLLSLAAARRPRDPRLALRLIDALAQLGRLDELTAAIEAASAAREPGKDRGELLREAALVCERADQHESAARLWRSAADHVPHDPRVFEGLAKSEERAERYESALALWDRAADAFLHESGSDDELAAVLRRAAHAAERLDRTDIAEERLTRAIAFSPGDVSSLARLARIRRTRNAGGAALRAEDALLEALQGAAGSGAEVARVLASAARAALSASDIERARSFTSALARVHPSHSDLRRLAADIDANDVHSYTRHPVRLLALDPARIANVLAGSPDPAELLAELRSLLPITENADSYRRLAAAAIDARVAPLLADALADASELVTDASILAALERNATDEHARTRWAAALANELARTGAPGPAALARARQAARARDTASLRAALNAAERAGDIAAALAIVELALEIVGDSPARRALEAARERLSRHGRE